MSTRTVPALFASVRTLVYVSGPRDHERDPALERWIGELLHSTEDRARRVTPDTEALGRDVRSDLLRLLRTNALGALSREERQ